jgi:hypothetical protein
MLPVIDDRLDLTKVYKCIEKQLNEAQEEIENKKKIKLPPTS